MFKYIRYISVFLLFASLAFSQENRIPQAPDAEDQILQFFFDGAWLPSIDAIEIGAKNYTELKNLRYGPDDRGLEGVQGYTKVNSTALTTYTSIRNGFQLQTDRSTSSYVLVQAENSGETASRLFVNTTDIPTAGDFSSSVELDTSGNAYRTDTTGAGIGRFSEAPNGVTYCNGIECLVWSGEEMRVGGFITMANADPYNAAALPIGATREVNNTLSTSGNTVAVGAGARDYFLVMTERPIQGVYFDLSAVNSSAAVLDIHYWKNDGSWAAISETDGTLTATETLSQDGWVTWDHITDASPYHYQGLYLYAYRFDVNAASATIQYVTVNAPMQDMLDLSDGVPRQPIQVKIWRNGESKFNDFTLEVNEYSYETAPLVAQLDAMTTSDYMIVMSEDRLSGIHFAFMAGWTNTTASRTVSVKYWNGSAYADVPGTEVDGTSLSTAALGQDGMVWWVPPSETLEKVKNEFGVEGYSYKISFSGTLSGTFTGDLTVSDATNDTEVKIETSVAHNLGNGDLVTITGITGTTEANGTWYINDVTATTFNLTGSVYANGYTAGGKVVRARSDIMAESGDIALDVVTLAPAQKTLHPFAFPATYNNRVLRCNNTVGKQANRCDFSQTNSTEIWNGQDSSDDGTYSLYFGGSEPLTAGIEIFNRYGSRVETKFVAFKDSEIYTVEGKTVEEMLAGKERVTSEVGCPAPLTLVSAPVGYEVAQDVKRNMIFWLDTSGPQSFDGQVVAPVKGVEKYFDPDDADCINFDEMQRARGWYDTAKKEINFLIPTGTSQTTNNTWLVYDPLKKKWFRKDTGDASFPQVGFPVQDAYGVKYIYGGIDTGYMMRLENGASWDGSPIEQVIETGDFWPTGNIWDLTRIRQIKFMASRIPEAHQLTIEHLSDTDDSLGLSGIWQNWDGGEWQDWEGGEWVSASLASIELSLSDSLNRIARDTVQDNLFGWTHRFEFSISTDETTKGLQPVGWGIVFHKENRRDE